MEKIYKLSEMKTALDNVFAWIMSAYSRVDRNKRATFDVHISRRSSYQKLLEIYSEMCFEYHPLSKKQGRINPATHTDKLIIERIKVKTASPF